MISRGNAAHSLPPLSEHDDIHESEAVTFTHAREPDGYCVRLVVRIRDRHFFVKVEDIESIQAAGNYARVHTNNAGYLIRTTLRDLEEILDPTKFARIHRGTIINLDRVVEIRHARSGDYDVLMASGTRLRLSRHYQRRILDRPWS